MARSVRKRDVTVILNDRVDDMTISDASIVTTRSGRKLVADLVVRHIQDVKVNPVLLKTIFRFPVRALAQTMASSPLIQRSFQKQAMFEFLRHCKFSNILAFLQEAT